MYKSRGPPANMSSSYTQSIRIARIGQSDRKEK